MILFLEFLIAAIVAFLNLMQMRTFATMNQ
jgi:hypothetical protein